MWLVALLLVGGVCAYDADDDDADSYDRYSLQAISSSLSTSTASTQESYLRTRSITPTTTPVRTLSPDEIRQVKGVLNDMMISGRDLRNFTPESVTDLQRLLDSMSSSSTEVSTVVGNSFTHIGVNRSVGNARRASSYKIQSTDRKYIIVDGIIFNIYERKKFGTYNEYEYPIGGYSYLNKNTNFTLEETNCARFCLQTYYCMQIQNAPPSLSRKACIQQMQLIAALDNYNLKCLIWKIPPTGPSAKISESSYDAFYERGGPTTTTTESTTEMTTTPTPTTPRIIDIRKLVGIIASLTMNTIESNITELFNATLQKYGIPMCGDTTTTEEPTYDFTNATVVSKCFVCGLETPGIPHNAYCADAFAGDFLPLVPVDPRARGQIAKYRKYCRYLDVPGVIQNETQPRSVFGRFTGGCSVRWIDLSGVYTQRACRNRRHAVMGKHYVSKRMAKLEMALQNEDNGCVISPMSSLVPLSRGISLYARFHACVCTGSWCNGTPATLWHDGLVFLIIVALVTS